MTSIIPKPGAGARGRGIAEQAVAAWLDGRKFNPKQPRDEDGKWGDGFGPKPVEAAKQMVVDGPEPANDKLKLAKKGFPVGPGESLVASAKVNTYDVHAVNMAALKTDAGPRLLLGMHDKEEGPGWNRQEFDAADFEGDEDYLDKVKAEQAARSLAQDDGQSVKLDREGMRTLASDIDIAVADIRENEQRRKAWDRAYDKAYAADDQEKLAQLDREADEFIEQRISSGSIPGEFGSIEWEVYSTDTDTRLHLGVKPKGAAADWTPQSGDAAGANAVDQMYPADLKRLRKQLGAMAEHLGVQVPEPPTRSAPGSEPMSKPQFCRALVERANVADGEPMNFTLSTPGVKRDGLDLRAGGWRLNTYRNNPVMLWAHNPTLPPVARVDAAMDGERLLGSVVWDDEDPFARLIASKYRRGFLNAVSVGWDFVDGEGRALDAWRMSPERIRDEAFYDLTELSAVPVPADPDALMQRQRTALRALGRELVSLADETVRGDATATQIRSAVLVELQRIGLDLTDPLPVPLAPAERVDPAAARNLLAALTLERTA